MLEFVPNPLVDQRYFATPGCSASIMTKLFHYSDMTLKSSMITPYLCYIILVLGYLSAILGLPFKRLAGLEAIIVCQVSMLTRYSSTPIFYLLLVLPPYFNTQLEFIFTCSQCLKQSADFCCMKKLPPSLKTRPSIKASTLISSCSPTISTSSSPFNYCHSSCFLCLF